MEVAMLYISVKDANDRRRRVRRFHRLYPGERLRRNMQLHEDGSKTIMTRLNESIARTLVPKVFNDLMAESPLLLAMKARFD
jgi:hypothetical protein